MDEFASSQETQRALGYLLKLQEDPETLEGFFNKYPGANPFTSWPFLKEPTEAFLRYFETMGPLPEQGGQPAALLANSIDDLKLKELVEEFDREFAAAKEQRVNASTASKKFVSALIENAKRLNITIPEASVAPPPPERAGETAGGVGPYPVPPVPQAPAPQEVAGTPVPPERIREIAVAAIQHPGPPEEKMLFFHALTSFASEQPNAEVTELTPRAVEVTEAARVLSAPISTFPGAQSFTSLATNNFQKGVAGVLDVIVPTTAKAAIINKILLQPLDTIVNHPETLPQNLIGTMTDRWGTNFVNSGWFTQLRIDANRMIGEQKSATLMSPVTNLLSDVATTVFRGPMSTNVIAYIETYRLVATQGVQMVSVSHYGNIALGYGSQLVRMGANYVMRKGIKAGIKAGVQKTAISVAGKTALQAVLGGVSGGTSLLITLGVGALKNLFSKTVGFFTGLIGMEPGKNPGDNLILIIGAGVVLIFFLPLLPLLNIPAFNQSMIDTSIATSTGGGMTGGPIINCQLTPDDPLCKFTPCVGDCRWPTSGYITQGPHTGAYCASAIAAGNTPSHASGSAANGIDIASFSGGPVYTPRAGTVLEAYSGCADNTGHPGDTCGGSPTYAGYGNHVILKTDDGYMLIFGHLESAIGVQTGQHVDAHAQLGWMDQTGSSTGTHLHFGVLSGGNVLDFVPTGNSALSPETINGCVTMAGCSKACPTTPVVAGK